MVQTRNTKRKLEESSLENWGVSKLSAKEMQELYGKPVSCEVRVAPIEKVFPVDKHYLFMNMDAPIPWAAKLRSTRSILELEPHGPRPIVTQYLHSWKKIDGNWTRVSEETTLNPESHLYWRAISALNGTLYDINQGPIKIAPSIIASGYGSFVRQDGSSWGGVMYRCRYELPADTQYEFNARGNYKMRVIPDSEVAKLVRHRLEEPEALREASQCRYDQVESYVSKFEFVPKDILGFIFLTEGSFSFLFRVLVSLVKLYSFKTYYLAYLMDLQSKVKFIGDY